MNINETEVAQRWPVVDRDIYALLIRPEISVSETELSQLLSNFNLQDTLIRFGLAERYILYSKDPNNISRGGHRHPETGIYITTFGLAYLTNILLISQANDKTSRSVNTHENILGLSHLYNNNLVIGNILGTKNTTGTDQFVQIMTGMYIEQIKYQLQPVTTIARTLHLFESAKSIKPSKFEPLEEVFTAEIGLSIEDYFRVSLLVQAQAHNNVCFPASSLTNAKVQSVQHLLKANIINSFLNSLSLTVEQFKESDKIINFSLDPLYTKSRFNPLLIHPIIKITGEDSQDYFFVPSLTAYQRAIYQGLYWWFHRFFEKSGKQKDFMDYMGFVFENYVGKILKNIYGKFSVKPEILYGKNKDKKFLDWIIERKNKVYLFEVKAYQVSLIGVHKGGNETFQKDIKKIADAVKQVFLRIQEINGYKELSHLKGKVKVPIIVFLDMPLVSTAAYKECVDNKLKDIEKGSPDKLGGLSRFQYFLLDIEELESYKGCENIKDIDEILLSISGNHQTSFTSETTKIKGHSRNKLLDNRYKKLQRSLFPLYLNIYRYLKDKMLLISNLRRQSE